MNRFIQWIRKMAMPTFYTSSLFFIMLFGWILLETYKVNNFGFASKTFWDWMELLLIPIVLAVAGLWFTYSQKQAELKIAEEIRKLDREIATERYQQQTLENYLDRMKELLLDKDLEFAHKPAARRLARALTCNVLRELIAKQNQQVIQFLQELSLLGGSEGAIVDLSATNLSDTDLRGTFLDNAVLYATNFRGSNLSGANLSEANLSKAVLDQTKLNNTILNQADLSMASLGRAELQGAKLCGSKLYDTNLGNADLSYADLIGAKLSRTNLKGANLRGATITPEQLDKAELSDTTIMPDSRSYAEWRLNSKLHDTQ